MGTPRLRQVVLITPDLDAALAQARELFGFTAGVRDESGMADLGFVHEVYSFGDTFLEIVAPMDPESPQGRLAARGGGGYMAVVQVDDLAEVVRRADELGFAPVLHEEYEGQLISQWHPKHLGTLAEFDEITPSDSWHFAPEIFANATTDVARDIAGVTLAVDDPAAMATTWATVADVDRPTDTTVRLGAETVNFVASDGGPRGLTEVDVIAADPQRVGTETMLCGVRFRFVAAPGQENR